MLRRLRLHLNAELRHLNNVTWSLDTRHGAIELAATAVDGVRERFWIRLGGTDRVWHVDALLSHVFKPRATSTAIAAKAVTTTRSAGLAPVAPSLPSARAA
jgi:hypothetical protein